MKRRVSRNNCDSEVGMHVDRMPFRRRRNHTICPVWPIFTMSLSQVSFKIVVNVDSRLGISNSCLNHFAKSYPCESVGQAWMMIVYNDRLIVREAEQGLQTVERKL